MYLKWSVGVASRVLLSGVGSDLDDPPAVMTACLVDEMTADQVFCELSGIAPEELPLD